LLALPFLLWKRQWRAAAAMVLLIVALNVLPAVYLGWDKMISCHGQWVAQARAAASVKDPALNPIAEPDPRNTCLQVAFARYLEHCWYPPEHRSPQDHPWFVHFGSLRPETAGIVVKCLLLALAGALAWRFRRPWGAVSGQADAPGEWAIVILLCALLSPLCWKQHLVLGLPCVFLALKDRLERPEASRWRTAALVMIGVTVIGIKRFVVGHELSILLASYKLDTMAMLLALGLTATIPRRRQIAAAPAALDHQAAAPPARRIAA
jgi:hypothetical protein